MGPPHPSSHYIALGESFLLISIRVYLQHGSNILSKIRREAGITNDQGRINPKNTAPDAERLTEHQPNNPAKKKSPEQGPFHSIYQAGHPAIRSEPKSDKMPGTSSSTMFHCEPVFLTCSLSGLRQDHCGRSFLG